MEPHTITILSLMRACDALERGAADLTIAAACSTDTALGTDAAVLADAIEREVSALYALLERHA